MATYSWNTFIGAKPFWAGMVVSSQPNTLEQVFQGTDFMTLEFYAWGAGDGTIGSNQYRIEAGDLFYWRPGEVARTKIDSPNGFKCYFFIFPNSSWDDFCQATSWSLRFPNSSISQKRSLPPHSALACIAAFERAVHYATLDTPKFELYRFLCDVLPLLVEQEPTEQKIGASKWLQEACTAMHRPELLREGVPALLRLSGRSPQFLRRAMQKALGMTPTEYVNRLRIEFAKGLLTQTDYGILRAASSAGFNNFPYFYRMFKKYAGVTPAEFRNNPQVVPQIALMPLSFPTQDPENGSVVGGKLASNI